MARNASEIVLRIVNWSSLLSFVAWFFYSAITVIPPLQDSINRRCLICAIIFVVSLVVRTIVMFLQRTKSWYEILFWPASILAFVLGILLEFC